MPFVSCTTFNTSQAAQDAATTAAIAAKTATGAAGGGLTGTYPNPLLSCPAVVACVAALPTGGAAVAGDLVLGSDGQYHALPSGSGTFATPAQTIAGTSTTLIVNPADLVARENIPAQTALSNDVSTIPAPAANQSPWGINALNEILHYAPGIGWQIVNHRYSTDTAFAVSGPNPSGVNAVTHTLTVPRTGKILASYNGSVYTSNGLCSSIAGMLFLNGANIAVQNMDLNGVLGTGGRPDGYAAINVSMLKVIDVTAGQVIGSGGLAASEPFVCTGILSISYLD